ncbi:unnamed protein product [Malus baccata var. baccata]
MLPYKKSAFSYIKRHILSTHEQQQQLPLQPCTAAPPQHHPQHPPTTSCLPQMPRQQMPSRGSSTVFLLLSRPFPHAAQLPRRVHNRSLSPTSKPTRPSSPALPNSGSSSSPTTLSHPNSPTRPTSVPKSWPLGFEDDDEDDGDGLGESFCLDSSCSTESTELSLTSLREFTRALEKVGLEVIELLCSSLGFQNPLGKDDPTRFSTMMWISEGLPDKKSQTAGRFYPYVVGLQYQIRSSQKYSLLADSGWLSVLPQVDSIMVTIGDIAQPSGRCISMSLLVTLPMDSTLSPLLQIADIKSTVDVGVAKEKQEGCLSHFVSKTMLGECIMNAYFSKIHWTDIISHARSKSNYILLNSF